MKKFIKAAAVSAAALAICVGACGIAAGSATPNAFQVRAGQRITWKGGVLSVAAPAGTESGAARLMLFGTVPVKEVQVVAARETTIIPCGTPFGIKLFTNGVVVVGISDIETAFGMQNPAQTAGLKTGDVITAVNGRPVLQNEEIAAAVEACNGKPLVLSVNREANRFEARVTPVKATADGLYKAGLWVRDSTAGIGTLTFYNPQNGAFAGLGHGICDTDTGEIMPLRSGEILPVTISGVTRGQNGIPGELRGYFNGDETMGSLYANVPAGVYGTLGAEKQAEPPPRAPIMVALRTEVKPGPVQILTTVDGGGPQAYNAVLESVNCRGTSGTKNMVIRVTDPVLLEKTGGIVQGMSGSPILQNGMLAGAVTHVFVSDPTRGYGIFADDMVEMSKNEGLAVRKSA